MSGALLWVIDCIRGNSVCIKGTPFRIGSSAVCDLQIDDDRSDEEWIKGASRDDVYTLVAARAGESIVFDGQEVSHAVVGDDQDHTLVLRGHPFALRRMGSEGRSWVESFDPGQWWVYKQNGPQKWEGPVRPAEVSLLATRGPGSFITLCTGMGAMGFYVQHVIDCLSRQPSGEETTRVPRDGFLAAEGHSSEVDLSTVNSEYGEFTCPVCWMKFDRGDVMSIAVHSSLRGDPVLGEEHMQRFYSVRFNDRGQALDAMGLAAPETACPHCRRKLPTGFLEQPVHIFSIVGAPTSGKSYFLSVLVKILQNRLFRDFGLTFRDAAPAENAILNDMKKHLFSASSPEEAYLAKTDLEGALYETLPRQGRQVRLPKPFVFRISRGSSNEDGFSMVFYDNAGEHFEPGRNSADSPGAQHIAVASGLFFLFDPIFNTEFRQLLQTSKDPQLQQKLPDQQDLILSEAEVRMKEILGLSPSERVSTPLAVIAGKSDAWIHLLGDEPLLPVVDGTGEDARIMHSNLRENSRRVRELLVEVCPSIVANAESISSDVCYFATSPLGHSPVKFIDGSGIERIGPDPKLLKPSKVEDAALWVLSKVAPALFPSQP